MTGIFLRATVIKNYTNYGEHQPEAKRTEGGALPLTLLGFDSDPCRKISVQLKSYMSYPVSTLFIFTNWYDYSY